MHFDVSAPMLNGADTLHTTSHLITVPKHLSTQPIECRFVIQEYMKYPASLHTGATGVARTLAIHPIPPHASFPPTPLPIARITNQAAPSDDRPTLGFLPPTKALKSLPNPRATSLNAPVLSTTG